MDPDTFFAPISHILPPLSLRGVPIHPDIPFPEFYPILMDYRFPVVFSFLYASFVSFLNPKSNNVSRMVAKQKGLKQTSVSKKSGKLMTSFVFFHNLALCFFSVVTFLSVAPTFLKSFYKHRDNFLDAYCDRDGCFWNDALAYWDYEIIDTLIILLKGRRSSLLQTYHHSGAMITMWAGMNFKAAPIWIFVVFNSFIHSIMYAYYALTSIGFNPPGKQYLTRMQITQFLVGTSLAISYLFLDDCLINRGQVLGTYINLAYLFPLIYLFVDFARNMYSKSAVRRVGSTGVAKKESM
ncbi:5090_t:CDS:2 [Acaulospora colombiana]|uniref:5090_t:CDS:1 n=1 Tax=Acaulospora colombiana TaxID=27376 RepID=A0ACA9KTP7_9GLOM|nr:5090_t:CDS:2 [Acaulospora colombiana]